MREITAKFTSRCAETGRTINKGDRCLYGYGKVYHKDSQIAKSRLAEIDQAGAIELERNSYGRRAV